MITLKRILIPTDLSDYSLAAIDYAASFGVLYNARLYLLFVADLVPPAMTLHGLDLDEESYRRRAETDARETLRTFIADRLPRDVPITPIIRTGVPADEIRRFADEERVDLVVMATHGRTGLHHMVMGSVAEKVVRLSRVPVLTVKPSSLRESIIRDEDIENELHLP